MYFLALWWRSQNDGLIASRLNPIRQPFLENFFSIKRVGNIQGFKAGVTHFRTDREADAFGQSFAD